MRSIPVITIALAIFINVAQAQESTYQPLDYDIYFSDNIAGHFKSERTESGSQRYVFHYNDRGRGPHLEETITVDDEGYIKTLDIIGHNYLKDTVNETFGAKATFFRMTNNGDTTFHYLDSMAFYSGVNSSFGNTEVLVRKLLSGNTNSVTLYPSGRVSASVVYNLKVDDTLELSLVAVNGMHFHPSYYWFDNDTRFFAYVSTWMSCIRPEYAKLRPTLLEISRQQESAHHIQLAGELTGKVDGDILIKDIDIFNSVTGQVDLDRSILIRGNTIHKVLGNNDDLPPASLTIDGTGKMALPGLFDMHTHISKAQGIMHLAAGVTSVRDLANSLDLPDVRTAFDENKVLGPRILIMCGFIDKAGPYAGPTGKIVESLDEALEAVDFYHDRGYQQIKLYSSIEPEWVAPIAQKTHALGMRLSGHIPAHMLASEAIEAGYDEIQHINMVALNFMSDTIDTRTPLRFSMVAQHAREIDVKGSAFQDFIGQLKSEGTVVDATVSIFEGMFVTLDKGLNPELDEVIDRLPVQVQRGSYNQSLPIPEGSRTIYEESYLNLLAMVKELYDSGIPVVPGTDAMPGFVYHNELEEYVRAGLLANEVLQMATWTSAGVTGVQDSLGSIEEGKLADIILVNGNPAINIEDIRKIDLVIKGGDLFYPEELYHAIGVKHYSEQ